MVSIYHSTRLTPQCHAFHLVIYRCCLYLEYLVIIGKPIVVEEDVGVTIDCSPLIDEAIACGIPNPTVTWFRDGNELNGSVANVEISADMRLCIINEAVGGRLGNEGNYSCQVCADPIDQNCRNRTTHVNVVCGK